jgi:hypothetical protein
MAHMVVNATLSHTNEASDLVLIFDAPYTGNVVKGGGDQNLSFVLTDTAITEEKKLSDPRIENLLLSGDPVSGSLLVMIDPFSPVDVTPAISKDRQTIRFRMVEKVVPSSDINRTIASEQPELGWRYMVAVAFMGVLLGVLWFVKKRALGQGESKSNGGGWLWGKKSSSFPFEVLFSKALDPKNRLILFRLNGVKYLILTGVNNVLIDRLDDEIVVTSENDFDHILRQNEETLSKMLGANTLSPMDRYRQNAES